MDGCTDGPEITLSGLRRWRAAGGGLCIYCAGLNGTEWFEILNHFGIQADLFLDNDSKKWGQKPAGGVACVSPLEVSGRDDCLTFVCVGPGSYRAVWETALNQDIRNLTEINELVDHLISHHFDQYLELIRFHAQQPPADVFTCRPNWKRWSRAECFSLPEHERIAAYTGIFGGYGRYFAPLCFPEKVDYYLISDKEPLQLPPQVSWIDGRRVIPPEIHSPVRRNRYIKMHAHEIFDRYRYSAYADGSILISGDVTSHLLRSATGISAFMHPDADCIFYEALRVTNARRVDVDDVCAQMRRYREEGMEIHFGMPEMCFIVRDHENALGRKVMKTWWEEFCAGAQRDQLSFSYALWKNGASMNDIALLGQSILSCGDFIRGTHPLSMYVKNEDNK